MRNEFPENTDLVRALNDALEGYNVTRIIRSGGNGAVLEGVQLSTGRDVAIKLLPASLLGTRSIFDETRVKRFHREIRLVSKLQLPNIIQVIDYGDVDDQPYFVMPLIKGHRVDEHCFVNDLSVRERLALFEKVLRAVVRAHQAGVIHRDLKPSNILVDQSGEPYILDFGLAKATENMSDFGEEETISTPHSVMGTFPYLSPERAMGNTSNDVRSDVYALGVVLFQMLTGSLPLKLAGAQNAMLQQIVHVEPKKLREAIAADKNPSAVPAKEIDSDLQAIVATAIAKDWNERYQSASAFASDIERYLNGWIVQARSEQRLILARRILRRYKVPIAAAVLAIVAMTWSVAKVRHERDVARAATSVAYKGLDNVVNNLDEELERLAGGKRLREILLADAEESLAELIEIAKSDPIFESLSTSLLERQGDLAASSGNREKAERFYMLAADQLQDRPLDLARVLRKAGVAVLDGRKYFEDALRVVRTAPDNELELANILIDAGRNDFGIGNHIESAEKFDEALTLFESKIGDEQLLAKALEWNGALRLRMGQEARGQASLEKSIMIREKGLSENPADVKLRRHHVICCSSLGTHLSSIDKFDEAIALLTTARNSCEFLVTIDPSEPDFQRGHAVTMTLLARVLREGEQYTQALDVATASIEFAEQFSNDPLMQDQVAHAFLERGKILLALGKPEDALGDASAALAIRESLLARGPETTDILSDYADGHQPVAYYLEKLGRSDEALPHLTISYEMQRDLFEKQPNVPERADYLVTAEINLANWHIRRKSPDDDDLALARLDAAETFLMGRTTLTAKGKDCLRVIKKNRGIVERRRH
ncbi:MAG TPA: serine/threonine-protein kinase [Phycisphaerae bacterium]|nr:serine/threonine-protein kinase [Phycisphaerae bacterium]